MSTENARSLSLRTAAQVSAKAPGHCPVHVPKRHQSLCNMRAQLPWFALPCRVILRVAERGCPGPYVLVPLTQHVWSKHVSLPVTSMAVYHVTSLLPACLTRAIHLGAFFHSMAWSRLATISFRHSSSTRHGALVDLSKSLRNAAKWSDLLRPGQQGSAPGRHALGVLLVHAVEQHRRRPQRLVQALPAVHERQALPRHPLCQMLP
jgi:hypothetical protein